MSASDQDLTDDVEGSDEQLDDRGWNQRSGRDVMYCSQCGVALEVTQRFCGECGAPVDLPPGTGQAPVLPGASPEEPLRAADDVEPQAAPPGDTSERIPARADSLTVSIERSAIPRWEPDLNDQGTGLARSGYAVGGRGGEGDENGMVAKDRASVANETWLATAAIPDGRLPASAAREESSFGYREPSEALAPQAAVVSRAPLNSLVCEVERELSRGNERKARSLLWKALGSAVPDADLEYVVGLVRPLEGGDARSLVASAEQALVGRARRREAGMSLAQERARQEAELARRAQVHRSTVTTDTIPGQTVVASLGTMWAALVRDRNAISDMGSDIKAVFGGELGGQTRELAHLTEAVIGRLVDRALEVGADGIVGLRLVSPDTGRGGELVAYGTAVRLAPQAAAV